jgi:hypothetical protein
MRVKKREVLEVKIQKMKILQNKVRIKIITALRRFHNSTFIKLTHDISRSMCRRSEKGIV